MLAFALEHWRQFAAFGIFAVLAVWQFWPAISGLRLPTIGKIGKAAPSRLDLLSHLDAAYEGFRAIGCEEGMAGVRALIPHAYHEHR